MIPCVWPGETAVLFCTGPSLSGEQIRLASSYPVRRFGVNLAYRDVDLDVLVCCNMEFYDEYIHEIRPLRCDKWHWFKPLCIRYGLNWIKGKWGAGLSTDPSYIHYGHLSSYQAINIAYHYGIRRLLLLGFDMRGPGNHYFGRYPEHLPKGGKSFSGLIKQFDTIDPAEYRMEIINCTPNSAYRGFPTMNLSEALSSSTDFGGRNAIGSAAV